MARRFCASSESSLPSKVSITAVEAMILFEKNVYW
jgi:hypothetical protein